MSVDRLLEQIQKKKNPSVAGLDPNWAFVPDFIKEKYYKECGKTLEACARAVLEFNRGLIDALYDIVPAVKPQAAYYELYGWQGMKALEETIAYAREKGMYVIADIKRNDIGTTAAAYATAYLGQTDVDGTPISAFGADSVTVNGYLGTDGIEPFLQECRKGKMIFALVKTSNPSSGELQDLKIGDKTVYETMAGMVNNWAESAMGEGAYSQVGAVVGATYPEQQKILRKLMPKVFFLVPGYGAQGATAADIAHAFDSNGLGAIVNSSRGIMCAYKKGDWKPQQYAEAARAEAIRMRDEIVAAIG
ncbi:MAG: orotidine-5'-phosphate decarboxylase [Eubacteriales bacterium]|jgi:orotidine-5'-phosphate decarboxylase